MGARHLYRGGGDNRRERGDLAAAALEGGTCKCIFCHIFYSLYFCFQFGCRFNSDAAAEEGAAARWNTGILEVFNFLFPLLTIVLLEVSELLV